MNRYSVLHNVTRADIRYEPYPHIAVESCLDSEIYDELAQTYPSDQTILTLGSSVKGSTIRQNARYSLGAHQILQKAGVVSSAWERFIRYHVSNTFFQECLDLFGPEILAIYPGVESQFGCSLRKLTTGIRYDPQWNDSQIALDCQIDINTPVTRKSSVRRVHTDAPDELLAMLFYFRRENDDSDGGNLDIMKWKKNVPHLFVGSEVDEGDAKHVYTVPYKPNTLAAFINSEVSLHAVTERDVSPVSRRLVNIMARLQRPAPEGLFFRKLQKKGLWPLARRAFRRYIRR